MAKYWSKSLFYNERRNGFWASAFLTGLLVKTPLIDMISNLNHLKDAYERGLLTGSDWGRWFGEMLLVGNGGLLIPAALIVGLLVVYQFHANRQEATGDLLASMPFTRRQIIFTKWVTGVMAIAVPFVVIFLLLTLFYWVNTDWITTPYRLVPQWAALYFLFLVSFYSFMFFVQTVMGHPGMAAVIGVICTMIPWYLLSAIPVILRQLLGLNYGDAALLDGIEHLGEYAVWTRWVRARYEYLPPDWTAYQLVYTNYGLKIIGMVAVIVLFYWLAERAYAKNSLEKNGKLLMFRFLEPVLIWGFAICLGILIVFLFGLGFSSGSLGVAFYLALGTAIGYWLAKKAVLYYQR